MFQADLAWVGPKDETVGKRKERKARQALRNGLVPASTGSPRKSAPSVWSTSSDDSSRPESLSGAFKTGPRALGKKERSPQDMKSFSLKPIPNQLGHQSTGTDMLVDIPRNPPAHEIDPPTNKHVKEDDIFGRHLITSVSARAYLHGSSADLHGAANGSIIDEIHEIQKIGQFSSVERVTTVFTEIRIPPSPPPMLKKRGPGAEKTGATIGVPLSISTKGINEQQQMPQGVGPGSFEKEAECVGPTNGSGRCLNSPGKDWPRLPAAGLVSPATQWKAPAEWDTSAASSPHVDTFRAIPDYKEEDDSGNMSHFQLFIRRMGSTSPDVIRGRLMEEWSPATDPIADQELRTEKYLWALTALEIQRVSNCKRPVLPPHIAGIHEGGRILELYGHVAEVYRTSALNSKDQIFYLTTHENIRGELPCNVQYLSVPHPGITPFPYGSEAFHHIRSSSLPALVANSKLPAILHECSRLLKKGGILEFGIMDVSPVGKSMGPRLRAWFEDFVDPNIEINFRCASPSLVLPHWTESAGLTLLKQDGKTLRQTLRIPVVYDESQGGVELELAVMAGRAIWQETWGPLASGDKQGGPRWWWEINELVEECQRHQTHMEISTLMAFKE